MAYSGTTAESYASERSFYIANKRGYDYGLFGSESTEYKSSQLPHGGELNTTNDQNLTLTWRNTIAYDHVFGQKHRLGEFAGIECRSSKYDGTSETTYGYFPDRGKTVTLPPLQYTSGTAKFDNPIYLSMKKNIVDKKSNYMSYFGSLTYSFAER